MRVARCEKTDAIGEVNSTVNSGTLLRLVWLLFYACVFCGAGLAFEGVNQAFANAESEAQNSEPSVNSEAPIQDDNSNSGESGTKPARNGFQEWNNRSVPMMSRLFVWIGFIMSIGLTAKILTAFNDRHIGLMTVIFVGCVGALTSMIVLPIIYIGDGFNPVSPVGFGLAVLVAFLILLFYSNILRLFGKEE